MDGSVANVRCHRCGTLLGFGSTMLYRMDPGEAAQNPTDHRGILGQLRQELGQRFGGSEDFCRRCGAQSAGVTGSLVSGSPRRRYEDAEGRIDIPRLLAAADSLIYGLKDRPLGLVLQDLSWNARGIRQTVGLARTGYVGEGPSVTQRAIEVIQGITLREDSNADRLLTELRAIVGIVMRHGSEEIRRDYLRKGNIHGDWNTLRLSLTERRHLTIEVDREPVEVEFAQWWTPEPVALAHLMPGGHPVMAASAGITHLQLLAAIKTLVPLQRNPQTLAEHQQAYRESYGSQDAQAADPG